MLKIGNRRQVIDGLAEKTGGGLEKKDLKYNKFGKIVSRKMSNLAKKENRLQNAGYYNIKGKFGSFKMDGGMYSNTVKPYISNDENEQKDDSNPRRKITWSTKNNKGKGKGKEK